jgi:hypothetical protein
VTVSSLGAGRQTCWERPGGAKQRLVRQTARNGVILLFMGGQERKLSGERTLPACRLRLAET